MTVWCRYCKRFTPSGSYMGMVWWDSCLGPRHRDSAGRWVRGEEDAALIRRGERIVFLPLGRKASESRCPSCGAPQAEPVLTCGYCGNDAGFHAIRKVAPWPCAPELNWRGSIRRVFGLPVGDDSALTT